jgi:hypothetical protein
VPEVLGAVGAGALLDALGIFWKGEKDLQSILHDQGWMLWSQFSAIFTHFRQKKWRFFSKTNVMITIFAKTSFVLRQKRQYFC